MTIPISYLHFGKLPGDALIRRTVALSTTQLDAGPDIESVTPVHKFIWPAGSISEYKFGITAIGLNIVWSTKSWLALLVPALLNGQFRY